MATENDPEKYEGCCYRQLLKYMPFKAVEDLTADFDGNVASAWKDWLQRLSIKVTLMPRRLGQSLSIKLTLMPRKA